MVWPRALALAEVTWSTQDARDWNSFVARMPRALRTLGMLGVNYRIPHVEGLEGDRLTLEEKVQVRLHTMMPGGEIRYTRWPLCVGFGVYLRVAGDAPDGARFSAATIGLGF